VKAGKLVKFNGLGKGLLTVWPQCPKCRSRNIVLCLSNYRYCQKCKLTWRDEEGKVMWRDDNGGRHVSDNNGGRRASGKNGRRRAADEA
jgi:hypothetical protein